MRTVDGAPLSLVDVRRWIRINASIFHARKIDILNPGPVASAWPEWLALANELQVRLSLRSDCTAAPGDLNALREAGLFDAFLCPSSADAPHLDSWMEACKAAALPLRMQLQAPYAAPRDPAALAERFAEAGGVAMNLAVLDPFLNKASCRDRAEAEASVAWMNALATAAAARETEVNLIGWPPALIDEANRVHALNRAQFFEDHQQYLRRPFELAAALHHRGPIRARIALAMIQSRHTLLKNAIDTKILPWLMNRPWLYARVMAWHKLTRHGWPFHDAPRPVADPLFDYDPAERGAYDVEAVRRLLPGLAIEADDAPARHVRPQQPKYYDAVDAERVAVHEGYAALARQANDIITNRPWDARIGPFEYGTDDGHYAQLEGAVEWHSVTNSEKVSWPLTTIEPPCTVSVTFGGGVAEYIGFSFGRHGKILCPMEETRHRITLHVASDGHYVLLRDGVAVRPTELEGEHQAPLRLPDRLELRLSVWNIDKTIYSQFVDIWRGDYVLPPRAGRPKYSVLIVNTKYARRLQAVLRCLAHQQDFDLGFVEVIVCYVPGVDATDDLIDSARATYPELNILRSPFTEQYIRSKGFIINESLRMVSGEWVVLLDADTLLPPRFFAAVDAVEAGRDFIAPDGRKLLPADVTARILMGELEPWRDWDALLKGPGELRLRESHGVPIGFCQCVRAACFDKVRYLELDHFEGSDMQFGLAMRRAFGKETRLTGLPALHLDHGGSQWYGTQKHF